MTTSNANSSFNDVRVVNYQKTETEKFELQRLPRVTEELSTIGNSAWMESTNQYQLPSDALTNTGLPISAGEQTQIDRWEWWKDIRNDHKNYYTLGNAVSTTGVFAIGAALAHSDADHSFRNIWQDEVHSDVVDDLSSAGHKLGDGRYIIAASLAATGLGYLTSDTMVGDTVHEWGYRTSRSLLVGFPALLIMQRATGGSRPGETSAESDWVPLADDNGVSGHAFVGAIPFICAAQMSENPWAAAAFYACGSVAGISRIHHDKHYMSQVMLGWWLAHLACKSVNETENMPRQVQVVPIPTAGGLGIGVQWEH